jgi:hypothetical protein
MDPDRLMLSELEHARRLADERGKQIAVLAGELAAARSASASAGDSSKNLWERLKMTEAAALDLKDDRDKLRELVRSLSASPVVVGVADPDDGPRDVTSSRDAIRDQLPRPGSLWRHAKTGNQYRVLGGGVCSESLRPLIHYASACVCRPGPDGAWAADPEYVWVRPLLMFLDGRFTPEADPDPTPHESSQCRTS